MRQIVCRDMPADVVYRHERLVCGIRKPLGVIDADKQRADQPGRRGHGHSVDPRERTARIAERLLYNRNNVFTVAARCDLRHDAAVEPVLRHLRIDCGRTDCPSIRHNGRSRLVTGAFNRQYVHTPSLPHPCCAAVKKAVISTASSVGLA